MFKVVIGTIVLAAAMLGLIALMMLGSSAYSCEVCMTYQGRYQCRTAGGATPEEATRTATDNACAFLASGMTASIQCGNTPPDSVRCDPPE